MSTTTVKFEPTHEISYRTPPDGEPEVWIVALQEDNTAVDIDGRVLWRVGASGRWEHTSRKVRDWPHGKLTVLNLRKPKKIKKGKEPKHMPAGTVLTLTRQADGSWRGYCVCNGLACERKSKGLVGLTSALCRTWLKEAGVTGVLPRVEK